MAGFPLSPHFTRVYPLPDVIDPESFYLHGGKQVIPSVL